MSDALAASAAAETAAFDNESAALTALSAEVDQIVHAFNFVVQSTTNQLAIQATQIAALRARLDAGAGATSADVTVMLTEHAAEVQAHTVAINALKDKLVAARNATPPAPPVV